MAGEAPELFWSSNHEHVVPGQAHAPSANREGPSVRGILDVPVLDGVRALRWERKSHRNTARGNGALDGPLMGSFVASWPVLGAAGLLSCCSTAAPCAHKTLITNC